MDDDLRRFLALWRQLTPDEKDIIREAALIFLKRKQKEGA